MPSRSPLPDPKSPPRPSHGPRGPLTFLLLLVGLSIPFWVLGAIDVQLAPRLPLSALMAFCPMTAALILVHREGRAAATALLWRAVDCRRIRPKTWYAPILLLMPAAAFLSYLAMRLVGAPLPSVHIPILAAPAMLLLFHVSAVGEELGWSGYLIDRLPDRWNALEAGIVVGWYGRVGTSFPSSRPIGRWHGSRGGPSRPSRLESFSFGSTIARGEAYSRCPYVTRRKTSAGSSFRTAARITIRASVP